MEPTEDQYRQHREHALADIEGVSPVVVEDHSVVFSDSQQPPAQRLGAGERSGSGTQTHPALQQ